MFYTFGKGDDELAKDEIFHRNLSKEIEESENRQLEKERSLAIKNYSKRIAAELLNHVSINDSERTRTGTVEELLYHVSINDSERTRTGTVEESHNQGEQFSGTARNSKPWYSSIKDLWNDFIGYLFKRKTKPESKPESEPENIQLQTFTSLTSIIEELLMNSNISLNIISDRVNDIAREGIEETIEELEKRQISFKTQRKRN
ncbi:uncharacterized protein LOC128547196 isoform X3 [Mercenaria mercenaria]|uniref:uncharacterized protein LOC128547196 isoform X3 n=1 Tax=Mercenaria mercenaria TaxID=6596 RepID=UPI00234E4031|nr:uncharacterized protein LOC128547196 isoform X3 [Mercenaria mercenaria]